MKVYIVMREEGIRSDGYYYESDTKIIGGRETPEEAAKLLHEAVLRAHPNEQPSSGRYNQYGDTSMTFDYGVDDLQDRFWIQELYLSSADDNLPAAKKR